MRFVSKKRELRLIRKPSDRIMDEFRRPIILRGERVEFEGFKYDTEDPGTIEWLLNHPGYGIEFTSNAPDKGVAKTEIGIATGPEVTDDLYKQEVRKQQVPPIEMVRGAMATITSPAARREGIIENPAPMDKAPMTEEQVGKLIDSKLEAGFERLMSFLSKEKDAPKAKHTVHCKDCGQEFGSGFEVGMHKKAGCPGKKE